MPENKMCKSSILSYIGNSKFPSTLLEELKLIFTLVVSMLTTSQFFMPFQYPVFLKTKSKRKTCL